MSGLCPRGHHSDANDYCDVCGIPMSAPLFVAPAPPPPPTVPASPPPSTLTTPAPPPPPPMTPISPPPAPPSTLGAPPAPGSASPWSEPQWEAVATADKAWYDTVHAEGMVFPARYVDRRFWLRGELVTIGRRSTRLGIYPDIDLSADPEDVGVSRQHAVLLPTSDGAWALVDPGSANGTYLNDSEHPVPTNEAVPLIDRDRIHIGAWTTIIVYSPRRAPG